MTLINKSIYSITKYIFLISVILIIIPGQNSLFSKKKKTNPYNNLVKNLSNAEKKMKKKVIAVIPFKGKVGISPNLLNLVTEERTTKLVNKSRFALVERLHVNKLLKELKLGQSGIIDSETAQKLGQGLGAEGLVLGTVSKIGPDKYRINCRIVLTDSFVILSAAQATIIHSERRKTAKQKPKKAKPAMAFLDIYVGINFVNLDYYTRTFTDKENDYYITNKFEDLDTQSNFPVGLRFFGIFKRFVSFSFGIQYQHLSTGAQKNVSFTTTKKNKNGTDEKTAKVDFEKNDIELNILNVNFDFLIVLGLKPVNFYFGLGLGPLFAWGTSQDTYASSEDDSTSGGLFIDFIFGVRFIIAGKVALFSELRYFPKVIGNVISFSEDDSVRFIYGGAQVLLGAGFRI